MKNILIDSNFIVAYTIPIDYSFNVRKKNEEWARSRSVLYVPSLFYYEAVTTFNKYLKAKRINESELRNALNILNTKPLKVIPFTKEQQIRSLYWAEKIGQSKVYDAAYLAAAESVHGEFWTADKQLVNAAHQAGAFWVHSLVE